MPDCYTLNDKSFVYQLGGKLLKIKTENYDTLNVYSPIDDNFTDYYYYSHDGAVAERHDDVSETKYFTRLGGELLACDSNGETYFYIQNIRGDVMMLVGTDGVVKSIRDYDASGQMLCKAPREDRDPFGFTGGLDAGKGLWKLGARFYDSSKSSFIQQDRYMGDPSDPLSLNRYVYCQLDPVNMIDPTGFMGQYVADFGRQLSNNAPFPVLKFIGMGIVGVGMAIILVEKIPDIINGAKKLKSSISNPNTGAPGSTSKTQTKDGQPKQDRTYGPDGFPDTDIDYDHDHGQGVPHQHKWTGKGDGSFPARGEGEPVTE